jgi:hypothetical protein
VTTPISHSLAALKRRGFTRAFLGSGHMIDLPNRPVPRFPPERETAVAERIERQLERWAAGARDFAACGAARGADLLFAEACVRRGVYLVLFIALPESDYLEQSVRLPGNPAWEQRYFTLRRSTETWFAHEQPDVPAGDDPFSRVNLWMLQTAQRLVPAREIHGLLVWDEKPTGDGPGGTWHCAGEIQAGGGDLHIVNPTRL